MQDADAHHRRRRIESSSVPRFPAILPRGGSLSSASSSSDSSSDQGAGDGDYKEPSAGNTPRQRSATPSRAVSPAAPRQQALRKSKSPASPSSSRASRQARRLGRQQWRTEQRTVSLGLQPRRATGYAKRRQASRLQEETGTVYTLQRKQLEATVVLEVGPANRGPSESGTGQTDGSAPTCSTVTVRRACAEARPSTAIATGCKVAVLKG
jgi:hypothetical protein